MFRKMRRIKQELPLERCKNLLKNEKRCVLSFIGDDGYPSGTPMNFYYDEESGRIYLHSALQGHRIDSLNANDKVCFTIYNSGVKLDDEDWAYYIASVMVYGRARLLNDEELSDKMLIKLAEKYIPTRAEINETMRKHSKRTQVIEIVIDHMTGKLVHEK